MRAIIILVILAVAGFFGYQYAVEGRGPNAAIGVLTGATAEAEAQAAADAEAQAAAEEAAAEAAEAATAEEAAAAAAAEAEAQAAAEEAAATQAETDTTEEQAIGEALQPVEPAPADEITSADTLLTQEGFDAPQVMALIENSDLTETEKAELQTAVTAVQDNPAMLDAVLDRLREVLGQ